MAIKDAIKRFERLNLDHKQISKHASKFSKQRFQEEMQQFIIKKYTEFKER